MITLYEKGVARIGWNANRMKKIKKSIDKEEGKGIS